MINADKPSKTVPLKDLIIHSAYLSTIVGIIFIYLITFKLAVNKEAVDYISFAATLASLILALLAIYLALSGNASLSAFLGGARELNTQASETQFHLRVTGQSNLATARELSEQVSRLSTYVTEMQGSINQGFEKLGSSINKQAEPNISATQPGLTAAVDYTQQISNFISWSSNYGLMITYIIFRIGGTDVEYNLEDLKKVDNYLGNEYALAYIVASSSAGIFVFKDKKFGSDPYLFAEAPAGSIDMVVEEILSRLARDDKRNPSNAKETRLVYNKLRTILNERLDVRQEIEF